MNNRLEFYNMGILKQNKELFRLVMDKEFGIKLNQEHSVVSGYKFLFDSETGGYIEVNFVDNGCQLITIFKGDYAWEVIEVYKAFSNRFTD
ncbi:hypothetical protein ACQPUQ_12520 [Clostridium paraputrificum]|uniref:hypothetical protein n=1 Tax=Clostridium paraputrificum TaxID=29363 RepID=UPI003D329F06